MKRQLKLLGVDFRTAVEKKDLRERLRAATDRAQLHTLSVSELHRRMTHMGISRTAINSASEKSQLIDLLLEAIRRERL